MKKTFLISFIILLTFMFIGCEQANFDEFEALLGNGNENEYANYNFDDIEALLGNGDENKYTIYNFDYQDCEKLLSIQEGNEISGLELKGFEDFGVCKYFDKNDDLYGITFSVSGNVSSSISSSNGAKEVYEQLKEKRSDKKDLPGIGDDAYYVFEKDGHGLHYSTVYISSYQDNYSYDFYLTLSDGTEGEVLEKSKTILKKIMERT